MSSKSSKYFSGSRSRGVQSKPHGYIFGAKLTFPVPLPPAYEGQKPKYRLMALPVVAVMCRVVVAEPTEEKHWAIGLGGTERKAICCKLTIGDLGIDETIFLD